MYYSVTCTWRKTDKSKKKPFSHSVPVAKAQMTGYIKFIESLYWIESHQVQEITKQEYEIAIWGQVISDPPKKKGRRKNVV
jgi:hypothetical protein